MQEYNHSYYMNHPECSDSPRLVAWGTRTPLVGVLVPHATNLGERRKFGMFLISSCFVYCQIIVQLFLVEGAQLHYLNKYDYK